MFDNTFSVAKKHSIRIFLGLFKRENSARAKKINSHNSHNGDPAGGYVEMLKARNSARGHLMAWSEKRAMHEYLKGLTENSNLNRKEYGTVMSLLLEIS